MPSLGFDMTAGKLARWLKNEGDAVSKGEAIAEVETEKATVEIEAFVSGVLQKILVPAGESVPVNTPIGVIAEAGEQAEPAPLPSARAKAEQPAEPAAQAGQPSPERQPPSPTPEGGNGRVKASPIARRIAEANNLDLRTVTGSGPNGRIMEKDVKAALAARPAAEKTHVEIAVTPPPAAPPQPAPARAPAPTAAAAPSGEVKLSRMRQTIAQRMTQSKTTAPHFYVTVEVNMADALKMREQLNALATDAEKLSVNDLVIAAVARTLQKHPNFNASFKGDHLELHKDINIGVAVAVEDGLLTPTLPNADQKSVKQIAAETKGMSERARTNRLRPEDMTTSTFTISNLGMFGVDEFSAIINPPQAAILALGAATKHPIVVDDQVIVAPMMKATISADHRVADGAQAARFVQDLRKLLENPVNLLLA
ncbi:MAG: dihydrolipoamide acetyltransferase family protein [Rudaea sp.]